MKDFSRTPREQLEKMAAAGETALESVRVLNNTGDNIVGELLRGQGTFCEWNHYPEGDVYDRGTHSQYYYHAHPKDKRPGEHGHFHTFLRPKGMPPRLEPLPIPGYEPPKGENDALCHLIAISMDPKGLPIGLFTTNRWVTGETWYTADDVRTMLECFAIDHTRPSWPVNRWVTAMVRLFRPQIEDLLGERDEAVATWAASHPEVDVYEDRHLEVTSRLGISVDDQIRRIQAALEKTA
ncbi:MAG: hypothetical protein V3U18_06465 [Alphaproteobacteria bacterium]